jgi:Tol biopolymer transport system component
MASARVLRLAGAAALMAAALPVGASTPAAASWPGSNGSIFVIAQEGQDRRIDRYNADGTFGGGAGSNVTEFSGLTTSADGSKLAYTKNGDIVLVDLNTSQESVVVATSGGDRDPAFSFDGRYLVYSSDVVDNNAEIYIKDLTAPSSEPIRLTTNTVDDWAPAWGDDGTGHGDLIAFVRFESDTDTEIYTMTPGGTEQTNRTNNNVFDFGPNWHPSFDRLAYSSRDAQDIDQIMTMSWDGTGKDQLTSGETYNYEPAWSPDGTMIAFTKQNAAPNSLGRIYVRPGTPGGTETPVTPSSQTVTYDRAEWQAFQCQENCEPDELQPVLFMNLKKHVVVSGRVEGTAGVQGGTCGVDNPMQIQRYSKGQFRPVANVTTNQDGTFSKKVPDKTGRYRVVSFEFTDEASGTRCLAATSPVKVHRHPR